MYLEASVSCPEAKFISIHFLDKPVGSVDTALCRFGGNVIDHEPGRLQLDIGVGDHPLDGLSVCQGFAKRFTLFGVIAHHVEATLRCAYAA